MKKKRPKKPKRPTKAAIKKAIRNIEVSRGSHYWWVGEFDMYPAKEKTIGKNLGDRKFHLKCVREYNYVIAVLKALL